VEKYSTVCEDMVVLYFKEFCPCVVLCCLRRMPVHCWRQVQRTPTNCVCAAPW
jgi:hypothetical protein